MTMPQKLNTLEPICRLLTVADLPVIASIHRDAFPSGILTAFGPSCVEKYYSWHLEGKHAVRTFGLEQEGNLIGFCVLLRHNQFSGFLRRALPAIVGRLLCSPSLILRPKFMS